MFPWQAWQVLSADAHTLWPALPSTDGSATLAMLFQLEQSQWLSPAALARKQDQQLAAVLQHAHASVPYYRQRWQGLYDARAPARAQLARLPLLPRNEVRQHYLSMRSESLPPGHGGIAEGQTSGSTGMPLRFFKSGMSSLMWRAFTLREHLWQQRDLGGTLAAMRRGGSGRVDNWGLATLGLIATGPCMARGLEGSVDEQLQWLEQEQPDYIITYPTNAAELARLAIARSVQLPRLRQVRTLGEALPQDLRALVRRAWNVGVADIYSTEETGYIALQCPAHEHYHVQSEGVIVEILDEEGHACAPGQTGQVVLTTLHNFAMPLVRYAIDDYAEFGEPCDCGRGLPVLRRILGRTRNMLVTADGGRYWPAIGSQVLADYAGVRQFQLAQVSFTQLEMRLVCDAPLPPAEEDRLRAHILSRLPRGLLLRFAYRDLIARGAGGKYEDFICELDAAALATLIGAMR